MNIEKKISNLKQETPEARSKRLELRKSQAESLQVPLTYVTGLVRAQDGSVSAKSAIKAKCHECVGYEDVKERISGCKVSRCPLLAYRPYK